MHRLDLGLYSVSTDAGLGSIPACALDLYPGRVIPVTRKIGTPVATLKGAWSYRVSTETGRPGVNILYLDEIESLICILYLSVAA